MTVERLRGPTQRERERESDTAQTRYKKTRKQSKTIGSLFKKSTPDKYLRGKEDDVAFVTLDI